MNFTDENNNHLQNEENTQTQSVPPANLDSVPSDNVSHSHTVNPNYQQQQNFNQNYNPNYQQQQNFNQNYNLNYQQQQNFNQNYNPNYRQQQNFNQNHNPNYQQSPFNQVYHPNYPQSPFNQVYHSDNYQQPVNPNYNLNYQQQNYNPNYNPNYQQPNTEQPYNTKNPYAQAFDPNMTYFPYINGTPVPPDATTHYINGMWYYAVQGANPKRKMATSVKVLLAIIITMAIALTVALFWWSSANSNTDTKGGSFNWEDFYKSLPKNNENNKSSSDTIGKYADPDGPEIHLETTDTTGGSTEKAYEKLSPSVVSISVYQISETPEKNTPSSEGSGIILSEDGYIVTNSHVINNSRDSNVYITTKNNDTFSAIVVGNDVRTDIAVLKCPESKDFSPATFTDSDNLKVGQDVVAIGSPGGSNYSSTITKGIVSSLNRTLSGGASTYIQTDTAINPGNSGGPLANLNGQVVGITTSKIVDTNYEGMGFAIPSVTVKSIADSIIKNGTVKDRPQLGIIGKEISETTAKAYHQVAGIQIMEINEDSPLKNTKAKVDDIIMEIDGTETHSFYQLFSVLDSHKIGDSVTLKICRPNDTSSENHQYFEVSITLIGE